MNDGLAFAGLVMLAGFFIPTIIAAVRKHDYLWVIFGLNLFGFTGITWLIAFIWSVFPSDKSLADPFLGNPTGKSRRNAGDTWGNVEHGRFRGRREWRCEHLCEPTG